MTRAADQSSPYRYATFWQRAGAAAFDDVLLYPVTMALHWMGPGRAAVYLAILQPALFWIYEVGTLARWGQTFGKMFTGVNRYGDRAGDAS